MFIFIIIIFFIYTIFGQDLADVKDFKVKYIVVEDIKKSKKNENFVKQFFSPNIFENNNYDKKVISRKLKQLYASKRFNNIKVFIFDLDQENKNLNLKIKVESKPTIRKISFIGNKNFSETDLTDKIEKEFSSFSTGDIIYDPVLLKKVKFFLEKEYLKEGIPLVKIKLINKDLGDNKIEVIFDIDESFQFTVSKIRFVGNKEVTESELKSVMKNKEKGLIESGKFLKENYDTDRLEIIKKFKSKGFIKVAITNVEKKHTWQNPKNRVNRQISLTYYVDEGEKYFFGDVQFNENNIFTKKQLQNLIQRKKGKPFNIEIHEAEIQRIYALYRNFGYIYCRITPIEKINDKNEINYILDIYEGDKAHIEKIAISGLKRTKKKVVTRELLIREGELFDVTKLQNSMIRLQQLNFFKNITPDYKPGSAEGLMNLVFNMEEQQTGMIQAGGTLSSLSGLGITASVKDINFLGNGQSIGFKIDYNSLQKYVELSFVEPWFFNEKINLGVSFSIGKYYLNYFSDNSQTLNFPTDYSPIYQNAILYTRDSVAFGMFIQHNFWRWLRYTIGNRLEYRNDYLSGQKFLFEKYSQEEIYDSNKDSFSSKPTNVSGFFDTITLGLRWDSRNHMLHPTFGINTGIELKYILGGYNVNKWKMDFAYYKNLLIENFVFVFASQLQTIQNPFFGEFNYLTTLYYYFNTEELRGWTSDKISSFRNTLYSSDGINYNYGKSNFRNSIEFRIAIAEKLLWGSTFFDMGNLSFDSLVKGGQNPVNDDLMKLANFMFSAGFGLRLDLQQFPVRVYLAWRFIYNQETGKIETYRHDTLWAIEGWKTPEFVFTVFGLF